MSKVLVVYYSAYGHIEALANAVAESARETGAKVDVKRVPEIVPRAPFQAGPGSADRHHRRSGEL
jgi:NAD(P)H dehydrogenase (quinone)